MKTKEYYNNWLIVYCVLLDMGVWAFYETISEMIERVTSLLKAGTSIFDVPFDGTMVFGYVLLILFACMIGQGGYGIAKNIEFIILEDEKEKAKVF